MKSVYFTNTKPIEKLKDVPRFRGYREFGLWLGGHERRGGKIVDKVRIIVGDIIYSSPLDVMEAFEE
jgi:hypothetical protein